MLYDASYISGKAICAVVCSFLWRDVLLIRNINCTCLRSVVFALANNYEVLLVVLCNSPKAECIIRCYKTDLGCLSRIINNCILYNLIFYLGLYLCNN